MVGQVLGAVGGLPQIFTELEVSYYLLKRLLGVRTEGDKKGAKVAKLSKSEVLMVNIGSLSTGNIEREILAGYINNTCTSYICKFFLYLHFLYYFRRSCNCCKSRFGKNWPYESR